MINEFDVLKKVKEVLIRDFEGATESNTLIDFPDTLHLPNKDSFYIVPNYSNYENLSTESDSAEMVFSVFIICKRDTRNNLTEKVMTYGNNIYEMFRNNYDLDGTVDFITLRSYDFYPSIEGSRDVQGMEILLYVNYTKDF